MIFNRLKIFVMFSVFFWSKNNFCSQRLYHEFSSDCKVVIAFNKEECLRKSCIVDARDEKTSKNPFLLFYRGNYVGNYDNFKKALNKLKKLYKNDRSK